MRRLCLALSMTVVLLSSPSFADTTPDYLKTLLQREQELKAAIPSGGEAAIFNLIEFYLERPQQGEYNVYPAQGNYRDIFAAHCWHQQLSGTEEAIMANKAGYAVLSDLVEREYYDAFALMARAPRYAHENTEALQTKQQQRWGKGYNDPLFLANQSWQQSMPELSQVPLRGMQDIPAAIEQLRQIGDSKPERPEPWAFMAQLSQMAGDQQAAMRYADEALLRYPNHYLANGIKAALQVAQYKRGHACDLEVVWQRLLQADEANVQSMLMVDYLSQFYNSSQLPHRLRDFDRQLKMRDDHDSAFQNPDLVDMVTKLGGRPWLTPEELAKVKQLRATIAQALSRQP